MDTSTPLITTLSDLCTPGTLKIYSKGELILRTDQTPPGVFIVRRGYVKVYSITDAGEENLHIIYGPDMVFPIIWAITGNLRQIFYEAMDTVEAYRIDRTLFLERLNKDIELNKVVLNRIVDMFSVYVNRVDNLEYTRGYSRIIYRLLKLAERFGTPISSGTLIQPPIKHHDIGNSTNCSRETVSREMEVLEKKGLITYRKHLIVITSIERLQKELLRS